MPLDEALDELYGVTPDEFMTARSALRDRLRDAGESAAAKELARARRPTTAAWALNQLAREHADLVEAVLDQTRELEAAQAGARPGQAGEVREAMGARRRALGDAADAAVAIAARITENAESYREPMIATLDAGSLDEDGAAALRAGRHVRDSPGRSGFPPASARRRPPAPKGPATEQPGEDDGADRAGERDAARTALEAAEAEARDAAERAEAGAAAARDAEARIADAETAIDRAKADLRTAKSDARDARAAAQELRRAADAAAKVAEVARRRFSNLGG